MSSKTFTFYSTTTTINKFYNNTTTILSSNLINENIIIKIPSSSTSSSPSQSKSSSTTFQFHNTQIQLRFLNPNDYEIVKQLCEEWFPVEYPAKWFEAITSDTNLYSLAASINGNIIGLIVSELKNGCDLSYTDRDLLCESQMKYNISYILSLGVVNEYRRQGIASLLLSSLLNYLSTIQCKAVYLHVLSSNEKAMNFYEKHSFRVHKFLPYYYSIGGKAKDGFTYVLYLNDGHGRWGICEYLQHCSEVIIGEICSLPGWCINQIRKVVHSLITFIR